MTAIARQCANCGTPLDAAALRCGTCGAQQPLRGPEEPPPSPPLLPSGAAGAADTGPAAPAHRPAAPSKPKVQRVGGKLEDGPGRFESLVADGYSLVATVGLSQHGKTDFVRSMIREVARVHGGDTAQEEDVLTADEKTERTAPGTFNAWLVQAGSRVIAIWDIAGEDFQKLRDRDQLGADTPLNRFLTKVLPLCRGTILTISLPNLWDRWNRPADNPISTDELRGRSEDLRRQLNTYVRFLQFMQLAQKYAGAIPAEVLGDDAQIKLQLSRARKIRGPVIVNFSKADLCLNLKTPHAVKRPVELENETAPLAQLILDPARHDPQAVAYLYVNELFKHLREHARYGRFIYSIGNAGGERSIERLHAGCLQAFDLVSDMAWSPSAIDALLTARYYASADWKAKVDAVLQDRP